MTPAEEKQLREEAACWRMTKFVWSRRDRTCLFNANKIMPFTASGFMFVENAKDKMGEGPTPEQAIESLFREITTGATVSRPVKKLPIGKPVKKLGGR